MRFPPQCSFCYREIAAVLDTFWFRMGGVGAACSMKQLAQTEERDQAGDRP